MVTEETVRQLATAIGIELADERVPTVAAILGGVRAAVDAFESVDLDGVEPEQAFKARWD